MGLIDSVVKSVELIHRAQGVVKQQPGLLPMEDSDVSRLRGYEPAYGDHESYARVYENIVWVYRSVAIIADNISRLPLRVVRIDKNGNEVDISDLADFDLLLRDPNPFQTRYDFMMESISRLLLQGEMFWRIQYADESKRRPEMIFADWRSDEVEIVPSADRMIAYFIRRVNGREFRFTPDEVFYIRYFNPNASYRGISPLHVSTNTAILELSAVDYNKRFFKEGMKFSGVFSTDQKLSEQEAKRLKEKIMEMYSGVSRMWEPAILWGGLKFQALNDMSLSDAEFSTLRTMNREEIVSAFGVPLEVIGVGKATYENLKFAQKLLWSATLVPLTVKLQEAMTKFLLPRLTGIAGAFVKFDLSDVEPLKEDRSIKRQDFEAGFKLGAVTPNEIRQYVFGFDPIESPEMDMTYLPLNIMPVGATDKKNQKGGNGSIRIENGEPVEWVNPYANIDDV